MELIVWTGISRRTATTTHRIFLHPYPVLPENRPGMRQAHRITRSAASDITAR